MFDYFTFVQNINADHVPIVAKKRSESTRTDKDEQSEDGEFLIISLCMYFVSDKSLIC